MSPTPNTSYIVDLGQKVIDVINGVLVPVLFAIVFIVFLWGVAKAYIISRGNEAEVNIVDSTFGLSGQDIQSNLPKGPSGSSSL